MRNLETVFSFRCVHKVYTAHALYVASEDWIMAQISVLGIFYMGRCCLTGCFCSTCENQSLLLTLLKMKTVAKRTIYSCLIQIVLGKEVYQTQRRKKRLVLFYICETLK